MRLTGNEVALISSGLTTLVAIISIVFSQRSTKASLASQHRLTDSTLTQQRTLAYESHYMLYATRPAPPARSPCSSSPSCWRWA
jgi:hypothetical protein